MCESESVVSSDLDSTTMMMNAARSPAKNKSESLKLSKEKREHNGGYPVIEEAQRKKALYIFLAYLT